MSKPLVNRATITSAVTAALVLLVSFGVNISDEQQSAILGIVAVLAPLVVTIARKHVTPVIEDFSDESFEPDHDPRDSGISH